MKRMEQNHPLDGSTLCPTCRSIDFAAISFQDISKASMTELPPSNHDQYEIYFGGEDAAINELAFRQGLTAYHDSLQSLIDSANGIKDKQAECRFCSLVLISVTKVLHSLERYQQQGSTTQPATDWSFFISGRSTTGSGLNIIGFDETANKRQPEQSHLYLLMAALEFHVDYDSALAPAIRSFNISQSNLGPILKVADQWIQHCIKYHNHPLDRSTLPTRILSISEDGHKVFLQTAYTEACGSYVALSYCWGQSATIRLTDSTLQRLTIGMNVSDLPQTFQDAIQITRSLGHSNVWIDSLCIKQDERDDWKRESVKMHHIYRNSVVTLAATRAADSSEGFLGPRIPADHVVLPYRSLPGRHAGDSNQLSRSRSDSRIGQMNETRGPNDVVIASHSPLREEFRERYEAMFPEEPLSVRAWTLQERMLSTRNLHFTSKGLYFECDHDFIAETGIPLPSCTAKKSATHDTARNTVGIENDPKSCNEIDRNTPPWTQDRRKALKARHKVRINFNVGAVPLSTLFKIHWRHLVSDFSQRKLAFPSDKFPAIAGIAAQFGDLQNHLLERQKRDTPGDNAKTARFHYHAGLFLADNGSIEPLQWQTNWRFYPRLASRNGNLAPSETFPQRPSTYRAPTWSWASLDAAIEWVMVPKIKTKPATIKKVHVEPVSADDIYGELSSAWLCLEAILCPLRRERVKDQHTWSIKITAMTDIPLIVFPTWDMGASYSHVQEREQQDDISYSSHGQTNFEVAILGMGGTRNKTFLTGLIIERSARADGNSNTLKFVRCGAAFIRANYQYSEVSREDYEILKKLFDDRKSTTEILLY